MNKAILDKIDELQSAIDAHGILDTTIQNKINYRFRLDWNYYSNEMEGNSLTRMETRQLMIENVTVGNKPLKDVLEMSGHDKEVLEIMRIGKGTVRLSESRIKAMHRAIMYESDPEKKQHIGHWKSDRNYVINYKGEKFEFVAPDEVAEAVHQLLNTTNAQIDAILGKQKDAIHPVELAFQFHLEYVRIHPFYDGNGRTARLLTNLLLISLGFPPVILRKKERELYYKYLADIQGYGANPDLFLGFMGDLVIHSQELVLDAIAGKDIEEEDDLDKEIALWKNQLDHESVVIKKSNEAIVEVYRNSLNKLLSLFLEKVKQFDDIFIDKETRIIINNEKQYSSDCVTELNRIIDAIDPLLSDDQKLKDYKYYLFIDGLNIDDLSRIGIHYSLIGFTKDNINTFDLSIQLYIKFTDYHYIIGYVIDNKMVDLKTKLLTSFLSNDEIKLITNQIVLKTFESIKISTSNKS